MRKGTVLLNGHTHVPVVHEHEDYLFVNPGSVSIPKNGSCHGYMTLENISPFIMTLIPLTVFMNERVRSYCNSAIAFLWIGMFIALGISPEFSYIFNFNTEASFIHATEASCHLIASLYGIYLIISGQVKCDFKHSCYH